MKNVFLRANETLPDIPLSDYTASQLCAYLLKSFPGDPRGALKILRDNFEVGFVLAATTDTLLGGFKDVENNKMLGRLSK